jgi:hypothetical protein
MFDAFLNPGHHIFGAREKLVNKQPDALFGRLIFIARSVFFIKMF